MDVKSNRCVRNGRMAVEDDQYLHICVSAITKALVAINFGASLGREEGSTPVNYMCDR